MTAYEHIAQLAAEELALVRARRFDELAALAERRRAAVAALPAVPGPSERAALERAHALQAQATAELAAARDAVAAELVRLDGTRRGTRAYLKTAALAPMTADVPLGS